MRERRSEEKRKRRTQNYGGDLYSVLLPSIQQTFHRPTTNKNGFIISHITRGTRRGGEWEIDVPSRSRQGAMFSSLSAFLPSLYIF